MKITIDTTEDHPETINATILLLQAHLKNSGATNIQTNFQQNSYQTSPEDRLAKKIAKAQARQESTPVAAMDMFNTTTEPTTTTNTSTESIPMMDMFSTPTTNEEPEQDDSNDENIGIEILKY